MRRFSAAVGVEVRGVDGATLPAVRGELKGGSIGMLVLVGRGERGEWVLERKMVTGRGAKRNEAVSVQMERMGIRELCVRP